MQFDFLRRRSASLDAAVEIAIVAGMRAVVIVRCRRGRMVNFPRIFLRRRLIFAPAVAAVRVAVAVDIYKSWQK